MATSLDTLVKQIVDDRIEAISSSPNGGTPLSELTYLRQRQEKMEEQICYLRAQLDRVKPLLEMFDKILQQHPPTIPAPPPSSDVAEIEEIMPLTWRVAK